MGVGPSGMGRRKSAQRVMLSKFKKCVPFGSLPEMYSYWTAMIKCESV